MRPWFAWMLLLAVPSCSPRQSEPQPLALPATVAARAQTFALEARAEGALEPAARSRAAFVRTGAAGVRARVSRFADGPMRLQVNDALWLELRALDTTHAAGTLLDGALRARTPGFDLAFVAEPGAFEEIRLLRTWQPTVVGRYAIRVGPQVGELQLRDGIVRALDRQGVERFASTPAWAEDARGVRRALTLALARGDDGWTLETTLDARGLEAPLTVDPGFTQTFGAMPFGAQEPFGVLLTDGRVLGWDRSYFGFKNAWLYDPLTDAWSAGKPFAIKRDFGLVLPDGQVALSGNTESMNTIDFWSPTTGHVATSAPSSRSLEKAQLTRMPDGRLFVAAFNKIAEIYDPVGKTWTSLPLMLGNHNPPIPLAFPDGKVLVLGANAGSGEVYDPLANTWTATASTPSYSASGTLHLLPSGRVAMVEAGTHNVVRVYDRTTNTWDARTIPSTLTQPRATELPGSKLLIVGGDGASYVFDMVSETFTTGPLTAIKHDTDGLRVNAAVVAFGGGRALVFGGWSAQTASEIYTPPATACGTTTPCAKGTCVDGYCCDRSCGAQCDACDVAGREGFCSIVSGEAPHAPRASCGTFATCYLGACQTVCTKPGDCSTGNTCLGGVCVAQLPDGRACGLASDCASGSCVDGVCCNSSCTGQCQACDVAGLVGTCSNVDGAPHGTRTSCSPYACSGGACATSCTTDAQCQPGKRCSAGACVAGLPTGSPCSTASECATTFCVDGVCCGSACNTMCQRCDVAGKVGTCSAATGVDARGLCAGPCANGCSAGACTYKAAATLCGTSCVGNTLTTAGTCSGTSLACGGTSTFPCPGGFNCADGVACRTSCTLNAHCATGFCETSAGTCGVAPPDAGVADTGAADAAAADTGAADTGAADTGLMDTGVADTGVADAEPADTSLPDTAVADTTVTDTGAADTGETDTGALDSGVGPADVGLVAEIGAPDPGPKPVAPRDFQRCTKGSECATGHCVEGVCCDTECRDRCSSCALLGSPGKCTPEPIGVDLKSECGPALSCLGTCDGAGGCIGAGKGSMCARNRCTGPSTGQGPAFCAAPGAACSTDEAVPFDCGPFACEPAFGACLDRCVSSASCANGFVCDLASQTCVAPSPGAEDGGCTYGRSPTGAAAWLGLLVLGALLRRRQTP